MLSTTVIHKDNYKEKVEYSDLYLMVNSKEELRTLLDRILYTHYVAKTKSVLVKLKDRFLQFDIPDPYFINYVEEEFLKNYEIGWYPFCFDHLNGVIGFKYLTFPQRSKGYPRFINQDYTVRYAIDPNDLFVEVISRLTSKLCAKLVKAQRLTFFKHVRRNLETQDMIIGEYGFAFPRYMDFLKLAAMFDFVLEQEAINSKREEIIRKNNEFIKELKTDKSTQYDLFGFPHIIKM